MEQNRHDQECQWLPSLNDASNVLYQKDLTEERTLNVQQEEEEGRRYTDLWAACQFEEAFYQRPEGAYSEECE